MKNKKRQENYGERQSAWAVYPAAHPPMVVEVHGSETREEYDGGRVVRSRTMPTPALQGGRIPWRTERARWKKRLLEDLAREGKLRGDAS